MHSLHVSLSFTACLGSAALLIQPDVCFLSLFSLFSLAPPQAPLICLTPLSDHAQQGVRVGTYWVHSRCQVLQQARQPCRGQRIYFSRLQKKEREHHSNRGPGAAQHLFRHFIAFGAACIGQTPAEPPADPLAAHRRLGLENPAEDVRRVRRK